jgi:hypothetical protein
MLKKAFEANFFFANILIPAVALALYCVSFAYFSSRYGLEGVNYFFAGKFGKVVLVGLAVAVFIFIGILLSKRSKLSFGPSDEGPQRTDILLLLLPLTPVVQYILINRAILSPAGILTLLIFFTLFSALYILVIPALLCRVMPARTVMIMGLAFVFTIVSMATVSDAFAWYEKGALRKQLIVFGGVFLVTWLLYNINQRKILYLFIVLSFAINSSMLLFSQLEKTDTQAPPIEQNKLLSMTAGRTPENKPNVYLLVYDAYVPNETMLGYGIDNSAQENFLRDRGFKLYPHNYSIASSTLATMSRVLNASTEYYGNVRRGVSGDGVVQRIFKELGYDTKGLFYTDFMFRGVSSSYDMSIPKITVPPYLQLGKAILLGEFRFDIEDEGFGKLDHDQFIQAKQEIFTTPSADPFFIYMHTNRPSHTQNSGACLPDETDQFKERLRRANEEMQKDVNLITKNDSGAIVIVAGDHGPYLTKNCTDTTGVYDISQITRLDIQDRYGSFLAIRWPTGDFVKYDDITVLQDVFPAVFAYLYKDQSILDAKIKPVIPPEWYSTISGASVKDGIIEGGINDGEPLYLSDK